MNAVGPACGPVGTANGQGAEELVYRNPGAFLNLSDWSSDGKTLTFAFSDMKGGTLYTLPLDGGPDRKATELFKTEMQVFGPSFSPDGRQLYYHKREHGHFRIWRVTRP